MAIEIKVPVLPESVSDATIAKWYKKPGDKVSRDENLVDLETDKVMLEVPALQEGILKEILKKEGETVKANEVIGILVTEAGAAPVKAAPVSAKAETKAETQSQPAEDLTPAVRRMVKEHDVDTSQIAGTGKDGRITRQDVESHLMASKTQPQTKVSAEMSAAPAALALSAGRSEQRVPMSRLRARIAERLLEVKQSTAMLTTFNEVNMQAVIDLRNQYKDAFEKTHGVKLGFMSFFVKASIEALKRFPAVNASIDGSDVVYHNYFDIGIAVSTDRGLVVPILRDADQLSMAEIEKQILDYSKKARDGKLTMEDMTGGTFTITNGGTFGSMLSTPILNSPQSAILGMHNIVKRPIVENDQIVIRPVMYLALSYDHRIIDGRDSVRFLYTIKEMLEDPARLILGI